ncbi:hypothetical protein PCASD_00979 [Puccinia coronata f. sp. avenae]|uniref:Uncharacterized protein n=1 Tax=Puccinia coronata f. sp. avenae TaxID=200324 RepID=A0A2N5VMU9_9BASI|nr:hypothetical protein PCASD_00979 [Puccinia coronata f. sp. avenae]
MISTLPQPLLELKHAQAMANSNISNSPQLCLATSDTGNEDCMDQLRQINYDLEGSETPNDHVPDNVASFWGTVEAHMHDWATAQGTHLTEEQSAQRCCLAHFGRKRYWLDFRLLLMHTFWHDWATRFWLRTSGSSLPRTIAELGPARYRLDAGYPPALRRARKLQWEPLPYSDHVRLLSLSGAIARRRRYRRIIEEAATPRDNAERFIDYIKGEDKALTPAPPDEDKVNQT